MATHDQYIQLDSLPEEVRKKVMAFIADLMEQWEGDHSTPKPKAPKKMTPGLAAGMVTIPDDFDDPLDDFKEYVQ